MVVTTPSKLDSVVTIAVLLPELMYPKVRDANPKESEIAITTSHFHAPPLGRTNFLVVARRKGIENRTAPSLNSQMLTTEPK